MQRGRVGYPPQGALWSAWRTQPGPPPMQCQAHAASPADRAVAVACVVGTCVHRNGAPLCHSLCARELELQEDGHSRQHHLEQWLTARAQVLRAKEQLHGQRVVRMGREGGRRAQGALLPLLRLSPGCAGAPDTG